MFIRKFYVFFLMLQITMIISLIPYVHAEGDGASTNNNDLWAGMGFGIGMSFTIDTGKNDRVKSASIVNGVVRVEDEENGIPRLLLEMHNFYWDIPKTKIGHGPFVAVQPGSEDIINAVALGWMIGLKYSTNDKSNRSFNLGIGYAADPNVRILGEGLQPNKPLPENETEIRYKEKTQYGVIIMFSTSW